MTTLKLVNLMMRSSDFNPYSGKLSKKDNILAAIELAKLTKDDWVDIYYQTENQDLKQVINEYKELLNNETVSRDILSKPVPANALAQKQVNIDGQDITLALVKK